MAKIIIKLKDNSVYELPVSDNSLKVHFEAVSTLIENCLEKGSGKLSGNLGMGTTTIGDKVFIHDNIQSIEVIF